VTRYSYYMITQQQPFSVTDWLDGRLPEDWFTTFSVTVDREEILIDGVIGEPESSTPDGQSGRIRRFREETRAQRIAIARELESLTGRKVSWAVRSGDTAQSFTRLSVPVMTRLAQSERVVLDTLVEAGVARSRSDALGWCVRLVGHNQREWLEQLDAALGSVREARDNGPNA
jgi:hypothetical protein